MENKARQEIEDKIENRIGELGDPELMKLWLDFLSQKEKDAERLIKRLSEKDPILVSALVGATIGAAIKLLTEK